MFFFSLTLARLPNFSSTLKAATHIRVPKSAQTALYALATWGIATRVLGCRQSPAYNAKRSARILPVRSGGATYWATTSYETATPTGPLSAFAHSAGNEVGGLGVLTLALLVPQGLIVLDECGIDQHRFTLLIAQNMRATRFVDMAKDV